MGISPGAIQQVVKQTVTYPNHEIPRGSKRNEHTTTEMNLKGIILRGRGQPQELTHGMIMFIQHFGKDKILEMKIRKVGGVGLVINTSAT